MPRPPVEVADVIRAAGESFFERSQKWFTWLHLKVVNAILRCRTAGLGGHQDACSGCGYQVISFNSCRNRHCPRCQANARDRWLEAREKELLPTRYVHVVFTLPQQLSPLALQNKREIYALLFRASAETLLAQHFQPAHGDFMDDGQAAEYDDGRPAGATRPIATRSAEQQPHPDSPNLGRRDAGHDFLCRTRIEFHRALSVSISKFLLSRQIPPRLSRSR
jgi:hypothetical protein